jgi:hypothetical protein
MLFTDQMADKKYTSKYSNNKQVSPAQYITEIICENKAKKDGLDLHYRFWTNRMWTKFYRDQIATANKLVQKYNDVAILRALKDYRASKIYSLRAPHLIPIIEEEQAKLDSENKTMTLSLNRPETVVFESKSKTNKKNIFSKLKDIEDEC